MSPAKLLLPLALLSAALVSPAIAAVEVKETPGKVRVEIDGKLFTEYCYGPESSHVYYHPIVGPGGTIMTRRWPMEEVAGEDRDHVHHRSLWFAHGAVNGVDFWSELNSFKKPPEVPPGRIVHDAILEAKGGETEGIINSRVKWITPSDEQVLTGTQTLRVYSRPDNERLFDFEITLQAGDKEVTFGDTKEGTMAIRIAESMRVKRSGDGPKGKITASTGEQNTAAWGKRAPWVDYTGMIDNKTYGIAIFDHPSNLRHPTRWHVRDYGLFAANPFCEHEMDKSLAKGSGDYKLAPQQSVTLKYRFYIHEGETTDAKVAERYSEYTAAK